MAVVGMPALAPEESAALEHDYRHHPARLVRQRSQILLLCADLDSRTQVARAVRCSFATVQRTLNLYQSGGRSALRERRGTRGTPHFHRRTLAWQKTLALAMEAGPEACGVPRPTWSVPLLVEYLAEQTGISVSERTVGRGLASLGYVCRRGTWTVRHRAEEDPDYRPKRKGSRRS